jgi:hypothetical protein
VLDVGADVQLGERRERQRPEPPAADSQCDERDEMTAVDLGGPEVRTGDPSDRLGVGAP